MTAIEFLRKISLFLHAWHMLPVMSSPSMYACIHPQGILQLMTLRWLYFWQALLLSLAQHCHPWRSTEKCLNVCVCVSSGEVAAYPVRISASYPFPAGMECFSFLHKPNGSITFCNRCTIQNTKTASFSQVFLYILPSGTRVFLVSPQVGAQLFHCFKQRSY